MPKKTVEKFMLIDGNALIHRGFHAIPFLTNKAGEPTNAVYGFTMILLRAIKDLKPTHIACTFDLAGPTFRHDKYADYKGTRVKAAQELYDQIPRVKEVVRALNIPIFEKEGYEADDMLGTLARTTHENNKTAEVMIVTGDMDTLQLVNGQIKVYTLRKGLTDVAVYDAAAVFDRYGLKPEQMIDYKALRGDPSDNIKGVAGIGEKGAIALIQEFGSLENLYKQIKAGNTGDKIKPRILQLLIDQEESARFSYELSTIVCDAPIETGIPEYVFDRTHLKKALELFTALEFNSLIDKLPKNYVGQKAGDVVEDEIAEETVLVDDNWQHDYVLVNSEERLADLVKELKKQTELVLDTETTGINPIVARLVGVSLSFKETQGFYIPAKLALGSPEFKAVLESDLPKIGHNIKYDYLVLQNEGIELGGVNFDTMIASYLLNAGIRKYSLDALSFTELGHKMQPISELIGKGKDEITMDQVDPEKVSWYACEDADATLRLKNIFAPQLTTEELRDLFNDLEMPLIEVLARMERCGITLDVKLLEKLSKQAAKTIADTEAEIYKLAGQEFNIASPKQMKELLFEKLGLFSPNNKKTKTGLSTAAGQLEKMVDQHRIILKILQYRELTKLQSTYLMSLPKLVNPETGRLHTNYNQTIAATGRLSSIEPNLQNIPIRGTGLGAEVRKAFVAKDGYKLLSLDYSQVELRVVAHLAQDEAMLEVFNSNNDIHTKTAMAVFGVDKEGVTADMRRDAKTINFGILYGLSSFGLSSRIGEVDLHEAKQFIDAYFKAYPQVKAYIEQIKADVNEQGFVKNPLGRIRRFPEIKSSQYFIRAAAERAAINFPIQSLAADIIKVAMINIHKLISEKSEQITMLLQVHDELVFEVREGKEQEWADKIRPLMEEAIKLSVPVTVEAKSGDNWGEMSPLK